MNVTEKSNHVPLVPSTEKWGNYQNKRETKINKTRRKNHNRTSLQVLAC